MVELVRWSLVNRNSPTRPPVTFAAQQMENALKSTLLLSACPINFDVCQFHWLHVFLTLWVLPWRHDPDVCWHMKVTHTRLLCCVCVTLLCVCVSASVPWRLALFEVTFSPLKREEFGPCPCSPISTGSVARPDHFHSRYLNLIHHQQIVITPGMKRLRGKCSGGGESCTNKTCTKTQTGEDRRTQTSFILVTTRRLTPNYRDEYMMMMMLYTSNHVIFNSNTLQFEMLSPV